MLGVPEAPHRDARETESVVRHWSAWKGKLYTDYLVTTLLALSPCPIAKLYDGRAGVESEIMETSGA